MLDNYLLYLGYMTNKIQQHFNEQKEYIRCSKGCSKCCMDAQFPYSEIEFNLIYTGYNELEDSIKQQVTENINRIIEEKERNTDKRFRYDCPFNINNECSVYYYRGLICRTFGLITFIPKTPKTPRIPFCAYEGLNYANVIDMEHNNISDTKYAQLGLKEEPKAYNVDYSTLLNEEIAEGFGFKFGEVKPLIDWFIDIKNKE